MPPTVNLWSRKSFLVVSAAQWPTVEFFKVLYAMKNDQKTSIGLSLHSKQLAHTVALFQNHKNADYRHWNADIRHFCIFSENVCSPNVMINTSHSNDDCGFRILLVCTSQKILLRGSAWTLKLGVNFFEFSAQQNHPKKWRNWVKKCRFSAFQCRLSAFFEISKSSPCARVW